MSKLTIIAASAATLPILAFATPVFAGSPGTLGGGDNYVAKNLTTSSAYSNNTTATCNDVVEYSMQLSNTQFGSLNNVQVKVSLPSNGGVSTATATTDLGGTSGTSDVTSVTLKNGASQSLVSGSTELYDGNGKAINALPDTIASNGVNIGTLIGSTNEFVNFKVKVSCPTVAPKQIQVCDLASKQIVTINESDFNSSKYTKDLTQCTVKPVTPVTPTTPTTLVNTGAGSVAGIFAAVAAVSAVASQVVLRRRQARADSN